MTYFDKKQLLSQNPTEPSAINQEIASFLSSCSSLSRIVFGLKKYQSTLLQKNSEFEAVLDAYWYYGYLRCINPEILLAHVLLKQIIQFLQVHQPDVKQFVQAFCQFCDASDNSRSYKGLYDASVYDFTFDKKKVFCQKTTIDIIRERLDTLIAKKQWLENTIFIKRLYKYYGFNGAQYGFLTYIENCVFVLLKISINTGFEAIQLPYNQINVVESVLTFCADNHAENYEEKFGILEKIRFINQQRIKQSKDTVTVDYFKPDQLQWLAMKSQNSNTKYLIALIGMDILSDMANRTNAIAHSIKKYDDSPYKNTFSLIQYKLNKKQHAQAYQQFSHTLQRLAQDKELSLSCRLRAMLVAYDYLDFWVDNHRELINAMISTPKNQWGVRSSDSLDNRLFFRQLFTLTDVLACVDNDYLYSRAHIMLQEMREIHVQDANIMEQIFSAIFEAICKQLDLLQKHQSKNGYLSLELSSLLLNYPLSIEKQWQVINKIERTRHNIIKQQNYFEAKMLTTPLVLWQEKINQSSLDNIQLIDEHDPYLEPWDKANLYWINHAIDKTQAFKALQACELIKKTETKKNVSLYGQLASLIASDNLVSINTYRIFHETKGDYEGYFDLMSDILSILEIDIHQIHNPKTFISLNHCPDTYMDREAKYFDYNNQSYQFIIYDIPNECLFAVALLNVFLEKINHRHRFYDSKLNFEYDCKDITTAKHIEFEELNKQLKLPIRQITWETDGFTPVDLSIQHQLINPDYQYAIEQGYVYLAENKIILPKRRSMSPCNVADWFIMQLPTVLTHIQNQINTAFTTTLNIDDEYANIKQIFDTSVHWHNMFIAISRRAIINTLVCDYQYRKYPLWDDKKSKQVFDVFMKKTQEKSVSSKKNTTNKTKLYIAIKQCVLDETEISIRYNNSHALLNSNY